MPDLPGVRCLDFDSELTGLATGRITATSLTPVQLRKTLQAATAAGYRLLYWSIAADDPNAEPVLELVRAEQHFARGRVTYAMLDTYSHGAPFMEALRRSASRSVRVAPFKGAEPTAALIDLAIASGHSSRFGTDPKFTWFRALYTKWIANTVARSAANPDEIVMVAYDGDDMVGFVTGQIRGDTSHAALLAVNPAYRRHGISSALELAYHEWMQARGATKHTFATQTDNLEARTVYEKRRGTTVVGMAHDFHFWLPVCPDRALARL